jgi:hypothetical protein
MTIYRYLGFQDYRRDKIRRGQKLPVLYSLYPPGEELWTREEMPGRLCLGKGFRKIKLPRGIYKILEFRQNKVDWHCPEDGYTYRIIAVNKGNPYCGKRISVWSRDLFNATAIC